MKERRRKLNSHSCDISQILCLLAFCCYPPRGHQPLEARNCPFLSPLFSSYHISSQKKIGIHREQKKWLILQKYYSATHILSYIIIVSEFLDTRTLATLNIKGIYQVIRSSSLGKQDLQESWENWTLNVEMLGMTSKISQQNWFIS